MNQEGIELESPQMEKESDSLQSSILAAKKQTVVASDTMPIVFNKTQSGLKQNDTMENLLVADGDGTAK